MPEDPTNRAAGWKITIRVPRPDGSCAHHVWVVAIQSEFDAREKLLLFDIPADATVEALSSQEIAELDMEPQELRRIS